MRNQLESGEQMVSRETSAHETVRFNLSRFNQMLRSHSVRTQRFNPLMRRALSGTLVPNTFSNQSQYNITLEAQQTVLTQTQAANFMGDPEQSLSRN